MNIVLLAALSCLFHPAVAHPHNLTWFERQASLDADLDLYWTVDAVSQVFYLAVHAKAASGWLGFGISEMGGMEGADIMFYESEVTGPAEDTLYSPAVRARRHHRKEGKGCVMPVVYSNTITDAHSLVPGSPVEDECGQDWTLLSAEVGTEGMVIQAERPLHTHDSQDWELEDDSNEGATPTRIFAAWGDEAQVSYHGSRVAQAVVFLFGEQGVSDPDPLIELRRNGNIHTFDVIPDKFLIPTETTWYEDTCFTTSVLPADGEFHAVGFEGLLDNVTGGYVHHLVLKGYYDVDCGNSSSFYADIFFWAHGVFNMALPDDVGFRFGGGTGGFKSIALQTHYNNPTGDVGMLDSSGIRVYYSVEPLPMDAGALQLGDPFISLMGEPLLDGKSRYSFSCPASCTREHFEVPNVTIFQHSLHMHSVGQRAQTLHYRNGELLRSLNVDYYSFFQAGGYVVGSHESGTLQAGDHFETECHFDTSRSSKDTVYFGLGSDDEMCIDFVFYYPAQPIPLGGLCGPGFCGGEFHGGELLSEGSDFNRTFGIVKTCEEDLSPDCLDFRSVNLRPPVELEQEPASETSGAAGVLLSGIEPALLSFAVTSLCTLLVGRLPRQP